MITMDEAKKGALEFGDSRGTLSASEALVLLARELHFQLYCATPSCRPGGDWKAALASFVSKAGGPSLRDPAILRQLHVTSLAHFCLLARRIGSASPLLSAEHLHSYIQLLNPDYILPPACDPREAMHMVYLTRLELEVLDIYTRSMPEIERQVRARTLLCGLEAAMERAEAIKSRGVRTEDAKVLLPGGQSGVLLRHYLKCVIDAGLPANDDSAAKFDDDNGDGGLERDSLERRVTANMIVAPAASQLVAAEAKMMVWRRLVCSSPSRSDTNSPNRKRAALVSAALSNLTGLSSLQSGCESGCDMLMSIGLVPLQIRAALVQFEAAFADRTYNTILYDIVSDVLQAHLGALSRVMDRAWESPHFGAVIDRLFVLHRIRMFVEHCQRDGYHSKDFRTVTNWLQVQTTCVPLVITALAFVPRLPGPLAEPDPAADMPSAGAVPADIFQSDDSSCDDDDSAA
eukprot:m.73868 g.73868  ORF g.73868 m.73868 type:complete len:460 (-) comp7746_c0_seq1:126-1505(-)